jgi:hypothetical protein
MINSSRVCIINEPYLKGDKENIYLPHSKHDIYKKKKYFHAKKRQSGHVISMHAFLVLKSNTKPPQQYK